jgi:hypothetical protein
MRNPREISARFLQTFLQEAKRPKPAIPLPRVFASVSRTFSKILCGVRLDLAPVKLKRTRAMTAPQIIKAK